MGRTYSVTMGDLGELVIPAAVCTRAGLTEGVPLMLSETPGGLVLMSRQQARELLRRQVTDTDLVGQLLTDRRAAAAVEDTA